MSVLFAQRSPDCIRIVDEEYRVNPRARPAGDTLKARAEFALLRLMSSLAIDERGCWVWQSSLDGAGYGHLSLEGQKVGTHRLSYVLFVGAIPPSLLVLHWCDNRPCCNPAHLFLGDQTINALDMVAKGRGRNQHSQESR